MPPLDTTQSSSSFSSVGLIQQQSQPTTNLTNNVSQLTNSDSVVSNGLLDTNGTIRAQSMSASGENSSVLLTTNYAVRDFDGPPVLVHPTLKQLSDSGQDFMATIPFKRTLGNQVKNLAGRELDKEMTLQNTVDKIRISGQPGSVRNLKYALGGLYPDYKQLRSAGVLETLQLYKENIGTDTGRKLLNVLQRQLSPRSLDLNCDGKEKKDEYKKKPSQHPTTVERQAAKDDAKHEYLSDGVRAHVLSQLVSPGLQPTWSESIAIYKILRDHVPVSSSVGESELTRCMVDAMRQFRKVDEVKHSNLFGHLQSCEWENVKFKHRGETRMAQPELPLLTAIMQFVSSDQVSAESKQAVAHAFIMDSFYRQTMSFPSKYLERQEWTTELLRNAYPDLFENWSTCDQVYEIPDPAWPSGPTTVKLIGAFTKHEHANYLIHEFVNAFRLRDGTFVGNQNKVDRE